MAETPQKYNNVVLIGFMGVGKSTLASRLAQRLRWDWLDTDECIEQQTGKSVSDIFQNDGEPAFRDAETSLLESWSERRDKVISTGGGAILRLKNREALRRLGLVVWLRASEDVIFERVSRNSKRPLLQTADPRGTIHRLLAEREPLYAEAADLQIDTGLLAHHQSVSRILARLQPAPGS